MDSGPQSDGIRVIVTFYDLCSQIWPCSPATEIVSGGTDTANKNASTNSSHTTDDTSLTNSKEKQELDDGSHESDKNRE